MNRRAIGSALLMTLALASCKRRAEYPERLQPAPQATRLTLFVAPANVVSTDTDCNEGKGSLGLAIKAVAEKTAAQAGYSIVTQREQADMELKPSVTLTYCTPSGRGFVGTTAGAVEANAAIVASFDAKGEPDRGFDNTSDINQFSEWAGHALIAELTQSERVKTYAMTATPLSTAASAPPPAPPPAAQAANPPAAAPPSAPAPAGSYLRVTPQPMSFALLVGIEKYRDLPDVTGARQDVARMRALMTTTLGLPASQVRTLVDDRATKSDIEEALAWLKDKGQPGGRLYFAFSGHGSPNVQAGDANPKPYLLPHGANPASLDVTAIPLSNAVRTLGESRAREVIVFLDTCFSGTGRSVLPPGTRALVREVEAPKTAAQTVVLSASGPSEVSGPAAGGDGGLFTKTVSDGLGTGYADQNGDGQITLAEIFRYVSDRVPREAQKENRKQTPALSLGTAISADGVAVAWGYPAR